MPLLGKLTKAMTSVWRPLRVQQGTGMKNGGWLKFDGTYKSYLGFKRKWAMFERTHLQQQNPKEKVQQFMEYCLEKEAVDYNWRKEDMESAWTMLDTFYDRPLLFVEDLMDKLKSIRVIRN